MITSRNMYSDSLYLCYIHARKSEKEQNVLLFRFWKKEKC